MKSNLYFVLFLMFIAFSGCDNGCDVSGKVAFQDGSPLMVGDVVFDSGANTFYGGINSAGEYKMLNAGKGISAGTYSVYISGAVQTFDESLPPIGVTADGEPIPAKTVERNPISLVADKYTSKNSGLECTVKGKTVFDIQVTKP